MHHDLPNLAKTIVKQIWNQNPGFRVLREAFITLLKSEASSSASARQNFCCRYWELWRALASARSVEHVSGLCYFMLSNNL